MTTIDGIHLSGIDLNLLVALDALLSESSVTRAAKRLGVSQSTMSHSLARLRRLLHDDLLVRSSRGMLPTPRALTLATPIRNILEQVVRTIAAAPSFDPRTARRTFTLVTHDYGEIAFLPGLFKRLRREAPGIDIVVRMIADDVADVLEQGRADVALAPIRQERPWLCKQALFEEKFVCMLRRGHPAAKRKLTLKQFVALPHALITPRGHLHGPVDALLERLGHRRRIALALPHFLAAPHVVACSDLCVTLPARLATPLARMLPVVLVDPPLPLAGFTMQLGWHERHMRDPAHKWLRGVLASVGAVPTVRS
jgi:DNA-binding transcriptional LysR family regulator